MLAGAFAAAKEELPAARIANRPAAGLFGQLQQGLALLERNFDQFRLGLDLVFVGQRRIAAHRGRGTRIMCRGARLARPWRGRRRALGAAGKAEAMNLADHRIAGDPAELGGDLAGGQAVRPQFLQEFDPLVRPAHRFSPRQCQAAFVAESNPVVRRGFQAPDRSRFRDDSETLRQHEMSYWLTKTLQYASDSRASVCNPTAQLPTVFPLESALAANLSLRGEDSAARVDRARPCNRMKKCRPARRHISFRLRMMQKVTRDSSRHAQTKAFDGRQAVTLALIADLCARRSRFRAGRGRLAVHG